MQKSVILCMVWCGLASGSFLQAQTSSSTGTGTSIASTLMVQPSSSSGSTQTQTSNNGATNSTGTMPMLGSSSLPMGAALPTLTQQPGQLQNNNAQNSAAGNVNCVPTPPVAHTDFEQFVANETDGVLPVFGRALFTCQLSTYAPVDHVPVPADYVIGPGDEIDIQTWGMLTLQQALVVDRNGQITVPQVGVLNVGGMRSAQLQDFLHKAISGIYKNFKLNVTLGQLRSIQVYVMGNVNQPGVYTLGSMSTLVNAIFAAGGPSATGSMRHLELHRNNQTVADFDLYDLAIKGDKSHDMKLLPGDVLFVPPVGAQIALTGNFVQPGIFELRSKTTVSEALSYAGGLSALASPEHVVIEHIEGSRRKMEELTLTAANSTRELHSGDLIRVFPISPEMTGSVTLLGNVQAPRRFVWHEGMRISDLIPARDALIRRQFWHETNQTPSKDPGALKNDPWSTAGKFPLSMDPGTANTLAAAASPAAQAMQSAQVAQTTPNTLASSGSTASFGSSANTGSTASFGSTAGKHPTQSMVAGTDGTTPVDIPINFLAEMQLRDAEINWDYAVIERLDPLDLTTHLIPFNLGKALDEKNSPEDRTLNSGDVITVFGRKDISVPMAKHEIIIQVAGEVAAPGIYRINPGQSLADALHLAGGLTGDAYLFGLNLSRISTKKMQQEQLDLSISQLRRDLVANYTNSAGLRTNLSVSVKDGNDVLLTSEQSLIDQLSAVQPSGRVVLQTRRDATRIEDLPEFTLEDGDSIVVPSRLNTVQVIGAVFNQSAFRYIPGKTVAQYLHDAGGASRDADTGNMYLIEADGSLVNQHSKTIFNSLAKTKLMPGDAIVIPLRFRSQSPFWQSLAPVASVLSQSAVTGAVVANYMK